jgi:uncharacterized FAD-dependent dehydrogenase
VGRRNSAPLKVIDEKSSFGIVSHGGDKDRFDTRTSRRNRLVRSFSTDARGVRIAHNGLAGGRVTVNGDDVIAVDSA